MQHVSCHLSCHLLVQSPEELCGVCTEAVQVYQLVKAWLQVDVAALRVRGSVLQTAEAEGLTYQAYWFSTTLALGAFLKVGSLFPHHPTEAG